MLLAIDIGNTSVAIGVYDGRHLVTRSRTPSSAERPAEDYARELAELLCTHGLSGRDVGGVALSSTVPDLEAAFCSLFRAHYGLDPLVVGADMHTGIPLRCDNPNEVGPDRILHAVGALDRHPPPLIVVDFGTALVLDAISADGEFLGGTIAPGVGIAADALFAHAARLPCVTIEQPDAPGVIGRNTEHAMQSGIVYGYAELVCGLVRRFKAEIGCDATVIATGGYASTIAVAASCIDAVEDDLNLEGLRLVYEANR